MAGEGPGAGGSGGGGGRVRAAGCGGDGPGGKAALLFNTALSTPPAPHPLLAHSHRGGRVCGEPLELRKGFLSMWLDYIRVPKAVRVEDADDSVTGEIFQNTCELVCRWLPLAQF